MHGPPLHSGASAAGPPESPTPAAGPPAASLDHPYDAAFWKACLANLLATVAIATLFRYADFVTLLGGTELHLGWIVGIGMIGSLSVRLFVGTWIDRYGTRRVWLGSLALLTLASLGHIAIVHYPRAAVQQPAVFAACGALRIAVFCAVAGIYGSSITFIARRVPVVRMAELLGMLGTSGFSGMVLGAGLADLLLGRQPATPGTIDRMFLASGLLALAALGAAGWATVGQEHAPPRRHPRAWSLLRRYHPGRVMVMGIAMGFGLGLPATFLRAFAAELRIPRIALFFAVYAGTAIVTRVVARRVFARFGLHRVVTIGLLLLIGSQFLFLLVTAEWQLAAPAFIYGLAHAVLFPAGFAEGCSPFPPRYRGLGTSLMLATYDLGQLLGAPIAGGIVHFSTQQGWPAYPVMFMSVAGILTVATLVYLPTKSRTDS